MKSKRVFIKKLSQEDDDSVNKGEFLGEEGEFLFLNYLVVDGEFFIFDDLGKDLFNSSFKERGYKITKTLCKSGNYLIREIEDIGKIESFHRWLMKEEREKFCIDNGYAEREIVVHHKDFDTLNNQKENLQVMTRIEHNLIHNRKDDEGYFPHEAEETREELITRLKNSIKRYEEGLDEENGEDDYNRWIDHLNKIENRKI